MCCLRVSVHALLMVSPRRVLWWLLAALDVVLGAVADGQELAAVPASKILPGC